MISGNLLVEWVPFEALAHPMLNGLAIRESQSAIAIKPKHATRKHRTVLILHFIIGFLSVHASKWYERLIGLELVTA